MLSKKSAALWWGICLVQLCWVRAHGQCVVDIRTGFDEAAGNALAEGAADDDYTLDAGAGPQPALTGGPGQGFPIPPWVANSAASLWISNAANSIAPGGTYKYEIRFNVAAGVPAASLSLIGKFAIDDSLSDVVVNGASTGIASAGFDTFKTFAVNAGLGLFVTGENVLQFLVVNGGPPDNPTGLRVDACVGLATPEDREIDISTGFDEDALMVLPNGAPDADYLLTGPPGSGIGPGPAVVINDNAFPIPPWVGSSVQSKWIGPQADSNGPGGDYTYAIAVDLPSPIDAPLSSLKGSVAADDAVSIFVNGQPAGVTAGGFGSLTPIPAGAGRGLFVNGPNTIAFVVTNGGAGPTGLRVDAEVAVCAIPPPLALSPSAGNISTGFDEAAGSKIPNLQLDDSYQVIGPPGTEVCRLQALVLNDGAFPIPPWVASTASSKWIGVSPDSNGPPGVYSFRIMVSVPAGAAAETLALTGSWSTDNNGVDILVNGASTGAKTDGNFTIFHPFPPNAGLGLFRPGDNAVEFLVDNLPPGSNPVGLHVDGQVVSVAGRRRPGDCNRDGAAGVADVVCYLRLFFPGFFLLTRGAPETPCGGGLADSKNAAILNVNGDLQVDLSDVIYLAIHLFLGGPPPVQGMDCVPVAGCDELCR
ncbi:MAG: hypothetical protein HY717_22460 [Planctomycetes bacterium]|nr:hypothetical protein [Planctomycetota bacterium]